MRNTFRISTGLAALAVGGVLLAGAATPSAASGTDHRASSASGTAHAMSVRPGSAALAPKHDDRHSVRAGVGTSPTNRKAVVSSNNWAGMAAGGNKYQGVYATWIQPKVTATSANRYSCTWVGIDGANNKNLIQTGTEADSVGGKTRYYAWMEILPASQSIITYSNGTPVPVAPGDSMIAEVVQTATPGVWTVYLKDVTQNWYLNQNYYYSGAGASAEWIQEATQVGGVVGPPAAFSTVTFNNLEMAYGGKWYYTNMTAANGWEIVQGSHVWAYPTTPMGASPQHFSVVYNG
jgi:hypothetical protein